MNRTLSLILLLLLLVLGVAYAASPFYAFRQLKEAALTGDKDQLNALVDFPAVKDDLKRQVDSGAVKLAREASGVGYPIAMVLGRLGSAFGDRVIDRLVTPEAISAMVRSGQVPHKHRKAAADTDGGGASGDEGGGVVTRYAYLTPDRFKVAIAPAAEPRTSIGLILARQGLFSWRLEQIELPKRPPPTPPSQTK